MASFASPQQDAEGCLWCIECLCPKSLWSELHIPALREKDQDFTTLHQERDEAKLGKYKKSLFFLFLHFHKVHLGFVGSVTFRPLTLQQMFQEWSWRWRNKRALWWCMNRVCCCRKRRSSRGLYLNSLAEEMRCCQSPSWRLSKEENNFSSLCPFFWLVLYGVFIEIDHSMIVCCVFLKGGQDWR